MSDRTDRLMPATRSRVDARAPTLRPRPWLSIACAILAASVWALASSWYGLGGGPLAGRQQTLLGFVLAPRAVAMLTLVAAAVGLLAALVSLWAHQAFVRRACLAIALIEVVVFGIALQSEQAIILAGYLVALSLPIALAVIVVGVVRRYRVLRWVVVLIVVSFVSWGVWIGALTADRLAVAGTELAAGFARAGTSIGITLLFGALAGCWAAAVVRSLRGSVFDRRWTPVITRHRKALTVVAACCALPYGLIRLTWCTPWPLLSPGQAAMSPELRLFGLCLGGGSLLGFVLTIGLIRPWGEWFPRWMPVLAARPVPVRLPVVAGCVVAGAIGASALPMLVQLTFTAGITGLGIPGLPGRVAPAFVFPFWLWAPALALAVWGYAGHRRGLTG